KREYLSFPSKKVTCITADVQTAGRGRFRRPWRSPPHTNLLASFCFQLPIAFPKLPYLAQLMAQSLATCLIQDGLRPSFKWPNDLLLNGKKVAGILCEVCFEPTFIQAIIGVGVNLNMEPSDLSLIDQPATSLKAETGRSWDQNHFCERLYDQFLQDLKSFKE
ncbi:MAG: biotin--[acetyl-CoA-carboxylase] ligase, partial [Chlamydiia bacterium]|nr:biotin--[acetyl-CoA-carboxylase] ligase [Chlamydiia bacterium]